MSRILTVEKVQLDKDLAFVKFFYESYFAFLFNNKVICVPIEEF
jgi:hypothetical protein